MRRALEPSEAVRIAIQCLSSAIACERIGVRALVLINSAAAALIDAGLDDWARRCEETATDAELARLICDMATERAQYAMPGAAQ